MGRPKFFRQRILTQAASLEAKGLFNYLVSEIRARREVALEEAIIIAQDVHNYMEQQLLNRAMGQIEFPAIAGREKAYRMRIKRRRIGLHRPGGLGTCRA